MVRVPDYTIPALMFELPYKPNNIEYNLQPFSEYSQLYYKISLHLFKTYIISKVLLHFLLVLDVHDPCLGL